MDSQTFIYCCFHIFSSIFSFCVFFLFCCCFCLCFHSFFLHISIRLCVVLQSILQNHSSSLSSQSSLAFHCNFDIASCNLLGVAMILISSHGMICARMCVTPVNCWVNANTFEFVACLLSSEWYFSHRENVRKEENQFRFWFLVFFIFSSSNIKWISFTVHRLLFTVHTRL